MAKKFKKVSISEDDYKLLKAIAKILGKPMSQVLADYIWSIAPWVGQYDKATVLFDNSKAKMSDSEQVLKVKISGSRKFIEVEE